MNQGGGNGCAKTFKNKHNKPQRLNKQFQQFKKLSFREWGSGRGTHVNPWLIHVNVWQKTLQYCKVISLQLIKINGKKIFLI